MWNFIISYKCHPCLQAIHTESSQVPRSRQTEGISSKHERSSNTSLKTEDRFTFKLEKIISNYPSNSYFDADNVSNDVTVRLWTLPSTLYSCLYATDFKLTITPSVFLVRALIYSSKYSSWSWLSFHTGQNFVFLVQKLFGHQYGGHFLKFKLLNIASIWLQIRKSTPRN